MSSMNFADLKNKTVKELLSDLAETKKELFNLRFQKSAGVKINASRQKVLRKTVARILTVFNQNKKG